MSKTILFQTIQFSINAFSSVFDIYAVKSQKSSISNNSILRYYSLVIFDPEIGCYQVLPLWNRVNPEAMAMK